MNDYSKDLDEIREHVDPELMPFVEKVYTRRREVYENHKSEGIEEPEPVISYEIITEAMRLQKINSYSEPLPVTTKEEEKPLFPMPKKNSRTKSPIVEGMDETYMHAIDTLIPKHDALVIRRFRGCRHEWPEGVRIKHVNHAYKASGYAIKYLGLPKHTTKILQSYRNNLESILED